MDDLRELVTCCVACVFEVMAKDTSFLDVMAGGGPFVRDLTSITVMEARRIVRHKHGLLRSTSREAHRGKPLRWMT